MPSQSNIENLFSFHTDHYTPNKDLINDIPIIQLNKPFPTSKDNKALAEAKKLDHGTPSLQ